MSFSQKSRKAGKEPSHHNGQTVDMAHICRWPGGNPILIRDASEGRQRSRRLSSTGSCRSGSIDTLRVLSATRVLRAAVRLALLFTVAVVHALVVLLSANKVGDCLGVFRCVGRLVVAADTRVYKGFLFHSQRRHVRVSIEGTMDYIYHSRSRICSLSGCPRPLAVAGR